MFSFSKGKMEIIIPKTSFAFDEPIEGRVSLELNKPYKAKGVSVWLVGQRKVRDTRRVMRNGKWINESYTKTVGVFSRSLDLDGEKEYPGNQKLEYPFKFVVPEPGEPQKMDFGDGTIGNILNTMQTFAPKPSPVEWSISAKLDVSGFDVNKSVKLDFFRAVKTS
jgi:hypothetical protein